MAKLTIGQKAQRSLKLLMGLRHPRVAEALGAFGFTQADHDEGYRLLKEATGSRLATVALVKRDPSKLEQLDAWENRWFPIASASLAHRFPGAHAFLFLNLSQTEGVEVIVSVTTFVDRLNRLASEPSLGSQGAAARQFLITRGLTEATVGVAEQLLADLGRAEPALAPAPTSPEQASESEAKLWQWYLEWGEIARVAVKDRRLLRELGFLSVKRGGAEEADDEGDEPVTDDAQPADGA